MFVAAIIHPLRAANAANAIPKYANDISFLPVDFDTFRVSVLLLFYSNRQFAFPQLALVSVVKQRR